jgi:hypothetical protein
MSAGLAERAVTGYQGPRLAWLPEGAWDFSVAEECIVWAQDSLGVLLDEWQKLLLRWMLARRPDGRWVCAEFALVISRQNGKSLVLLIRCLFGIVKLGERKTVFSAHLGDTIAEMFRSAQEMLRTSGLTEGPGQFWQPFSSAGREEILFHSLKASMRFKTRTKSGGRGLTGDVVVLDEAQELRDEQMDAITSLLASKSMTGNPQLLFAGSAGNFESTVFARVRRRGIAGGQARLGFAEWSIDDDAYFRADTFDREAMVVAVESFAQANPTFGLVRENGTGGISEDYLRDEIGRLSPAGFAREHLGVGTWPKDDAHDWVIPRARWTELGDAAREIPAGPVVFALSAAWGQRLFSIAAAVGEDGDCHGWLERQDEGSAWVVPEVLRLVKENETAAVLLYGGGPASSLAEELEKALQPTGVTLHRMSGREAAQACGALSDAVTAVPSDFTHRAQVEVNAALAGARKKDIGDGLWCFDRRKSETDVAPLEALAYARQGWVMFGGATEAWGFFE